MSKRINKYFEKPFLLLSGNRLEGKPMIVLSNCLEIVMPYFFYSDYNTLKKMYLELIKSVNEYCEESRQIVKLPQQKASLTRFINKIHRIPKTRMRLLFHLYGIMATYY